MNKKDPICGMEVDEKEAKEKGLVVKDDKATHYFCSEDCKKKFIDKEKASWYKSETFGKLFPYVLVVILVGGAVWAYLGNFMVIYMGIFFIVFSLAKMPDWKGFVRAFSTYDILAKNIKFYGWIYPGIEFVLGILYLTKSFVTGAAWATLFIMGIGAIGVGNKILKKEKFQCACLGTKINVPLTKITLLEDVLMFVMALMVLFL